MLTLEHRPRPAEAERAIGLALGSHGRTAIPDPPETAEPLIELAGLPCLARKPKGTTFTQWFSETLVQSRGVMAALPRNIWPASATEADPLAERIVALDPTRAAGQSWWWLWRLKASEYTQASAYSVDEWTNVYHTDGLEAKANDWLPCNADYDTLVLSSFFDRITLAGFAVTVRHLPPPVGDAPGTLNVLPALHQRLLLELEAGAMGSGPAVLATMLVHEKDKYGIHESTAASANQDTGSVPRLAGDTGRIVASVAVTQTHSFRLSDLLIGYNKVLGDPLKRPTLPAIDGSVFELTMAIARRVRGLAKHRILKLNMVPECVVFCPHLVEDSQGRMQAQGYGYEGMQAVKGIPYLWNFDPLYTKRISSQITDYDTDSAYVVMMLTLLSTVRAQHGETVARIMIHRVTGKTPDGAAMSPDELPEHFDEYNLNAAGLRIRDRASAFCGILRAVLPVYAKEHEHTLGTAYNDMANDFAEIVRDGVLYEWTSEVPDRPVFASLVRHLTGSSAADTALFNAAAAPGDALLERERAQRVEQRLDAVRIARIARLKGAASV